MERKCFLGLIMVKQTDYLAISAYTGSQFGFHQPEQFKIFEFKDAFNN